jgi:hypothetical protein
MNGKRITLTDRELEAVLDGLTARVRETLAIRRKLNGEDRKKGNGKSK